MLSLVKAVRSGVIRPITFNNVKPQLGSIHRSGQPSSTNSGNGGDNNNPPVNNTCYDCRKFGHRLPANCTYLPFECFRGIPSGVFRTTAGEILGPDADKLGVYKQAEYFSFHHSSFYDLHLYLQRCRMPQFNLKRKPVTF